jgi:hypothetical protein
MKLYVILVLNILSSIYEREAPQQVGNKNILSYAGQRVALCVCVSVDKLFLPSLVSSKNTVLAFLSYLP